MAPRYPVLVEDMLKFKQESDVWIATYAKLMVELNGVDIYISLSTEVAEKKVICSLC